jgi:hypothetical protein
MVVSCDGVSAACATRKTQIVADFCHISVAVHRAPLVCSKVRCNERNVRCADAQSNTNAALVGSNTGQQQQQQEVRQLEMPCAAKDAMQCNAIHTHTRTRTHTHSMSHTVTIQQDANKHAPPLLTGQSQLPQCLLQCCPEPHGAVHQCGSTAAAAFETCCGTPGGSTGGQELR